MHKICWPTITLCQMMGEVSPEKSPTYKNGLYADHHLTLIIAEPTRVTSDTGTLIDHIATNKPEYVSKSEVNLPLLINRCMRIPKIKKDPKTIDIRELKSFDDVAFLEELKLKKIDTIKDITRKPNEMWAIWNSFFLDVLKNMLL